MILSKAQRLAASIDVNTYITACPGAGKTRVVAAKIQREIHSAVSMGLEIGCVTYTNAARDEIAWRCRSSLPESYLEHVRINTLHSFLLDVVLKPFAHLLAPFAGSFFLATPGSQIFEEALAAAAASLQRDPELIRSYCAAYWRDTNGEPISKNRAAVSALIRELEDRHATDFEGVIYYSNQILAQFPSARSIVANRFAWLLVDEYQDFNPPSLAIIERIATSGDTKVFLVGDIAQAIYDFKGVDENSLHECAAKVNALRRRLGETYRCGPRISGAASKLGYYKLEPAGEAGHRVDAVIAEAACLNEALSSFLRRTAEAGIARNRIAVLARTGAHVDAAVLALTLLGHEACRIQGLDSATWLRTIFGLVLAVWRDRDGQDRRSIYLLRDAILSAVSALGIKTACRLTSDTLYCAVFFGEHEIELAKPLRSQAGAIVTAIMTALINDRVLRPKDLEVFREACRSQYRQIIQEEPTLLGTPSLQIAEYARPQKSVRCMTIHTAKGLEFDAVLLIGCDQGELPFRFERSGYRDVEGDRKKFFVALTRAKSLFQATYASEPSQFLRQSEIV